MHRFNSVNVQKLRIFRFEIWITIKAVKRDQAPYDNRVQNGPGLPVTRVHMVAMSSAGGARSRRLCIGGQGENTRPVRGLFRASAGRFSPIVVGAGRQKERGGLSRRPPASVDQV